MVESRDKSNQEGVSDAGTRTSWREGETKAQKKVRLGIALTKFRRDLEINTPNEERGVWRDLANVNVRLETKNFGFAGEAQLRVMKARLEAAVLARSRKAIRLQGEITRIEGELALLDELPFNSLAGKGDRDYLLPG